MTKLFLILFGILSCWPSYAFASLFHLKDYHAYGPIPIVSQNPLYLQFVSVSLERAVTLRKKALAVSFETTYSNLFEWNPSTVGIGLDLDMEVLRSAFNLNYGVTDSYEVGLQLPFLSQYSGFLDSFIQGYHDLFGFPNAGRDRVANGRFSYRVLNNNTVIYEVDRNDFSPNNLFLTQKLNLIKESKLIPALSFKGVLKVPTGTAGQGSGSGKFDFGMTILAEKSYRRLHSYSQIGFLRLGGHDDPELNALLRRGAFLFGQALEFNLFEHLSFIGQVTGNTSVFKATGISQLSEPVLDLTFGFTGAVPLKHNFKKIFYRFGFAEDPLPNGPSVDFSVFLNSGVEY